MQFTIYSIFFVLIAMLSSSLALPILHSRTVFDPKITYPMAGDIFKAGQTITVTWDTSSLPPGTPNRGMLVLGKLTETSENLNISSPLAVDFLLTAGSQSITFPDSLKTGSNYIIDLFGDSGNISPKFTIYGA